jgi:hypothetical protein
MYVYTIYTRPPSVQAQYSRSRPIINCSCYNGSLLTWTVVCLTAAEIFLRHRCLATSAARTTENTAVLLLRAFVSAGMCLRSRCLAMNYFGFQASVKILRQTLCKSFGRMCTRIIWLRISTNSGQRCTTDLPTVGPLHKISFRCPSKCLNPEVLRPSYSSLVSALTCVRCNNWHASDNTPTVAGNSSLVSIFTRSGLYQHTGLRSSAFTALTSIQF